MDAECCTTTGFDRVKQAAWNSKKAAYVVRKGYEYNANTVDVQSQGRVAKTTSCIAIAECLASQGRRMLVVDADHQCAASELLVGEERLNSCEEHGRTLHDLMGAMLKPEFVQRRVPGYVVDSVSNIGGGIAGLDLIPDSMRIDDIQSRVHTYENDYEKDGYKKLADYGRTQIRRFLVQNYDYTFIDCPPSVPAQVKLPLQLSDGFIVPCVPGRLSVRGRNGCSSA